MPYTVLNPALAQAAPIVAAGSPLTVGSRSLAEMRAYVQDGLGGRTDIAASIDSFINKSYRWLFSTLQLAEQNFSFSLPTVIDQSLYLLPTQAALVKKVSVSDSITYFTEGRPLRQIDLDGYRRLPAAEGEPERFLEYEFGEQSMLVLWPIPTTVKLLAIDAEMRPVLLAADNHVPILPYDWHEVIEEAAVARALKHLREWQGYSISWMHTKALIREKKSKKAQKGMGSFGGMWRPRSRADLEHGVRNVINPDSDEGF